MPGFRRASPGLRAPHRRLHRSAFDSNFCASRTFQQALRPSEEGKMSGLIKTGGKPGPFLHRIWRKGQFPEKITFPKIGCDFFSRARGKLKMQQSTRHGERARFLKFGRKRSQIAPEIAILRGRPKTFGGKLKLSNQKFEAKSDGKMAPRCQSRQNSFLRKGLLGAGCGLIR